ncbi:MAG: hypothetical protein KDD70_03595 [Bdellovibrionales bacterium]|nr:hypothetical protein [Bdellovibrionales bacterium]
MFSTRLLYQVLTAGFALLVISPVTATAQMSIVRTFSIHEPSSCLSSSLGNGIEINYPGQGQTEHAILFSALGQSTFSVMNLLPAEQNVSDDRCPSLIAAERSIHYGTALGIGEVVFCENDPSSLVRLGFVTQFTAFEPRRVACLKG